MGRTSVRSAEPKLVVVSSVLRSRCDTVVGCAPAAANSEPTNFPPWKAAQLRLSRPTTPPSKEENLSALAPTGCWWEFLWRVLTETEQTFGRMPSTIPMMGRISEPR